MTHRTTQALHVLALLMPALNASIEAKVLLLNLSTLQLRNQTPQLHLRDQFLQTLKPLTQKVKMMIPMLKRSPHSPLLLVPLLPHPLPKVNTPAVDQKDITINSTVIKVLASANTALLKLSPLSEASFPRNGNSSPHYDYTHNLPNTMIY
jgi:hypothetical protein